ncbi:MAG: hypothetical protein E3J78_05695 [Candidatus Cloacimonadota bacterium]|nr:MAG: hypothetical protein E3J78_05695 [Candidatus Cloacimonadota bacterium]
MTLKEIAECLEAEIIVDANGLEMEIKIASGSDLMSDVLAFSRPKSLLLTGLTNPQSVRTAEMSEMVAICFVRGKMPPEETVNLAREKEIPLLLTKLPMFESCGKLYGKGLAGSSEYSESKE